MAGVWKNMLGSVLTTFGIGPKATRATLDSSTLTTARTYPFPDDGGTIALQYSTHIEGLKMQWVGAAAITVTTGCAYIVSSGRVIDVISNIAKTGLTLSANTLYHVYLYLNSGVPDIEIVTTAPSSPYKGTARTKSGDNSRRYIGSVRTLAANTVAKFIHIGDSINYQESFNAAPFLVYSNATGNNTLVSLSGLVPISASIAIVLGQNNSTNAFFYISNDDWTGFLFNSYRSFFYNQTAHEMQVPVDSSISIRCAANPVANAACSARLVGYKYDR